MQRDVPSTRASSLGWRAALSLAAASAPLALMSEASAITWLAAPPPVTTAIDPNGVDLGTGHLIFSTQEVAIGPSNEDGLTYSRTFIDTGWRDNLSAGINYDSTSGKYFVSFGGSSETFSLVSGNFVSDQGNGSTLTFDGTRYYTFTDRMGTVVVFDNTLAGSFIQWDANRGRVVSIQTPTNLRTTFTYVSVIVGPDTWRRLQSVNNNLGYQLHLDYEKDVPTGPADLNAWRNLVHVTGLNNAVDYCPPTQANCDAVYTQTWPSATYGQIGTTETVANNAGDTTRYVFTSGRLTGIRRPSSPSTNNVTLTYASNRVATFSGPQGAWSYTYTSASGVQTNRAVNTDGLAADRWAKIQISTNRIQEAYTDEDHRVLYSYDTMGRVISLEDQITDITTSFDYDNRGNITRTYRGGVGVNVQTFASFDASCLNVRTCNQPNTTTDERGFVTEYAYSPTYGELLSVTLPSPDGTAPRPQTRFGYVTRWAYFKNASGAVVQSPQSRRRLSSISSCATSASCSGTADETITQFAYVVDGSATDLQPKTQTLRSGNTGTGSISVSSQYTYTPEGDVLTTDGPLGGTGDVTVFYYDDDRRPTGVVGPDPDGASGPLKYRATQTTYNVDGQAILVERGTFDSQNDPDWSHFTSLQGTEFSYDPLTGRLVRQTLVAGGPPLAVQQISYDALGRQTCAAVRINPTVTLPLSACDQTTPGVGEQDRIVRQTYDNLSRPLVTTTGFATSSPIAAVTYGYTGPDDLPVSVTDADGNVSTFQYDSLRRLYRVNYPGLFGSPYEQFTYNAASQVTQLRNRDASTVTTTYDNLGRATFVNLSIGNDITRTYDNFNRLRTAVAGGQTLTYQYDQLSRLLSETGPQGAVSYQYDLASRRTRMDWPSTLYVTYDYDLANGMTAVRENGAASGVGVLATYTYDDLGRRTRLARGNLVNTDYDYDTASRLTSLTHSLSGTPFDDRSYGVNSALQITSRTLSNNAYAQTFSVGGSYYTPFLNTYASVDAVPFTYSSNGNLTSIGGFFNFTYDVLNRMTSLSPNTASYDPQSRLYQTVGTETINRQYDGSELIAEYNSAGTALRRFVHGPGVDEPLVSYEGSGLLNRSWLIADERGSIASLTNNAGAVTNINTYDEYGTPAGANVGRFQYTGQVYLPELGMYYYRARMYAPTLGRFMQPDPARYKAGPNLYLYATNDPINFADPLGLCARSGRATAAQGSICAGSESDPSYASVPGNIYHNYRYLETADNESVACAAVPEFCINFQKAVDDTVEGAANPELEALGVVWVRLGDIAFDHIVQFHDENAAWGKGRFFNEFLVSQRVFSYTVLYPVIATGTVYANPGGGYRVSGVLPYPVGVTRTYGGIGGQITNRATFIIRGGMGYYEVMSGWPGYIQ